MVGIHTHKINQFGRDTAIALVSSFRLMHNYMSIPWKPLLYWSYIILPHLLRQKIFLIASPSERSDYFGWLPTQPPLSKNKYKVLIAGTKVQFLFLLALFACFALFVFLLYFTFCTNSWRRRVFIFCIFRRPIRSMGRLYISRCLFVCPVIWIDLDKWI